jgi:hypothetical protein
MAQEEGVRSPSLASGIRKLKKSIIFEHVPLLEHEDMPGNDNDELGVESGWGWLGGRWGRDTNMHKYPLKSSWRHVTDRDAQSRLSAATNADHTYIRGTFQQKLY